MIGPPLDAAAVRAAEFPWMDTHPGAFLNAASVGPMPQRAQDASARWLRIRAEPHRLSHDLLLDAAATARRQFGALIGATEEEIAILPNTTYGLNLAARALPLRAGTVLAFDGEFPSCVYPFQALGERGVTLELIPKTDGLPDEDALVAAITERPDVVAVVVSWVQFASGYVADLARIGTACRARGAFFIVDGIQGVGVRPLDVHALPIDLLACGAQKWLLGPWGTGFAYVRRALIPQLEPHDVGWACMKGAADYRRLTDYAFDLVDDARRFEVVTIPYHDLAVANASTALLLELGTEAIGRHLAALGAQLADWAARAPGVRLLTPEAPTRRAGVLAFTSDRVEVMAQRLEAAGVIHSVREGAIRLSPHVYTTPGELDRVLALLEPKSFHRHETRTA